jgi:hypothetical protein
MLNNKSVKDAYALPRIEEMFDVLNGASWFSTIDMKSGYHQVKIEEEHKERTAFTVGAIGFFDRIRMTFGLLEECLGGYNLKTCIIYLDDLIIFFNSFEQYLERLDLVLQRLEAT